MGSIMLIVAVSRGLAIPKYLADLGLLSLQPSTAEILMKASFAVMAAALLIGAFIILKNMIQGMRMEKQKEVSTAASHAK
jgi:Na+-translocating ferredoxin:NAD+ oxidoreductase RnfD subunit